MDTHTRWKRRSWIRNWQLHVALVLLGAAALGRADVDPSIAPKKERRNPGEKASRANRGITMPKVTRTELPLSTALPAHFFPYFHR